MFLLLLALALPLAAQPITVAMENLTHPGLSFQVADQWRITVTGAPSQAVSIAAYHDGISIGPAAAVTLDATGSLVLTGKMAASQIGDWQESFNGAPLAFTVQPAPALVMVTTPVGPSTPNSFACPAGRALVLALGWSGVQGVALIEGEDYTLVNGAVALVDTPQVGDVVQLLCQ
jgi:hypothetical protein